MTTRAQALVRLSLGLRLFANRGIAKPSSSQARLFGKKAAKMSQHLHNLDDMAHAKSKEREVAEKRQAQKKAKAEPAASTDAEDLDDIVFEDDDVFDADAIPQLPVPKEVKRKMQDVVARVVKSFEAIRGGEPTPELFDAIMVDAYGERTPLSGVAQVVIASPTLANVTCFDPSLAKEVCSAIRDNLELNPLVEEDGNIKVPLPRISMEVRQQTVKQLGKQAESARIRLRNIRHKAMDSIKLAKDGKMEGVSKDDAFRVGKEIDIVSEEVTKELNALVEEKQARVMAV
jgi:ribosome recycling factor